LKRKRNDNEAKCRFNFPIDPCDKTTLEFEPIHTNWGTEQRNTKCKLLLKEMIRDFSLQLQGWRANCDVQVVK